MLGDAGIGWHIRTGELILANRSVPHADPFSSTMLGKPWYAWEWLYDAGVAAIHHSAGLNGVVFASALVIALTFTLLFRRMLAQGANLVVAVGLLLLAFAASTLHMFARPHVVGWLLTLVWFGILDQFESGAKPRSLLWLPLLMLLWVNLHGGFVLGLILLPIYWLAALSGYLAGRSQEGRRASGVRLQALSWAGVISFALTFVNPYGYKLHIHIYRYLTDRFLMDHIDEFLSPNFHGLPQKCFAILILLTMLGIAAGRKRLCISHLLIIAFAVYTGLVAARNIPVSSVLLTLIIAPQLSSWLRDAAAGNSIPDTGRRVAGALNSFSGRMARLDSELRGHCWPGLMVLLGLWICGHGGQLASHQVMTSEFDSARFPVAAAEFLERSGIQGPVFCPDRWGGYLIYRLYPGVRVAVDDRHDLYGAEFLKRYLKIVHGQPGWQDALDEMKAGWVLVPADSTLNSLLTETQVWSVAYRDPTAILFRHRGRVP
ncbi:MAG: hypothetical protein DMG81_10675 [Acidobacteria bacterium]|nr:MAG: hypothetical protein DMG81_10675 [Acidobacteriota bacterium]